MQPASGLQLARSPAGADTLAGLYHLQRLMTLESELYGRLPRRLLRYTSNRKCCDQAPRIKPPESSSGPREQQSFLS
jgi:hypothetical protein